MKTTFSDIVNTVIQREGGFVNHPNDRGGATNMGVTIGTLQAHGIDVDKDGDIDVDDVESLPVKTAMKIYFDKYWKPSKSGQLPGQLREFYFDMVVHHGPRNAVSILQHAAVDQGKDITIDGKIGPNTLRAVKYLQLNPVVKQRLLFFFNIVLRDQSQKVFLEGWVNRCFKFLK